MVALLGFTMTTLADKKLLDAKGPFGGNVIKKIWLDILGRKYSKSKVFDKINKLASILITFNNSSVVTMA